MLRFLVGVLLAGLTLGTVGSVCAQAYPNKPIRVVTTGTGGGSSDIEARVIAQGISEPLGQQVVVEGRPTVIAGESVAKAPPDGYTLLIASSPFFLAPLLQKVPYDPVNNFSPITMVSRETNILVVHPSLPVKSVKDLIALAKANPGALNYGSGTTGSITHLAGELFKSMAGVDMVRIGYKSGGAAAIDLVGGHVPLMFATAPSVVAHIKSGRLRAVAITSGRPSTIHSNLPTIAATLPGYEIVSLDGVLAPAKTPSAIINRLNQEIVRFLRTPEARDKFLATGTEVVSSTPEELAAAVNADIAKVSKLIKDANIKSD